MPPTLKNILLRPLVASAAEEEFVDEDGDAAAVDAAAVDAAVVDAAAVVDTDTPVFDLLALFSTASFKRSINKFASAESAVATNLVATTFASNPTSSISSAKSTGEVGLE